MPIRLIKGRFSIGDMNCQHTKDAEGNKQHRPCYYFYAIITFLLLPFLPWHVLCMRTASEFSHRLHVWIWPPPASVPKTCKAPISSLSSCQSSHYHFHHLKALLIFISLFRSLNILQRICVERSPSSRAPNTVDFVGKSSTSLTCEKNDDTNTVYHGITRSRPLDQWRNHGWQRWCFWGNGSFWYLFLI